MLSILPDHGTIKVKDGVADRKGVPSVYSREGGKRQSKRCIPWPRTEKRDRAVANVRRRVERNLLPTALLLTGVDVGH